jgi:hypothetical protein
LHTITSFYTHIFKSLSDLTHADIWPVWEPHLHEECSRVWKFCLHKWSARRAFILLPRSSWYEWVNLLICWAFCGCG